MTRHINIEGLEHIKRWEGCELRAYRDVAGVLTIGYGHTSAAGEPPVVPGMEISQEDATEILRRDLEKFEQAVERNVKVPLNPNQFAALVSFTYNVGEGNLQRSTLLKKLNARDYDAVPGEMAKWIKAGGRRVQGLVNRRAAEAGLWSKGAFVASQNVQPDGGKSNPILKPEVIGAAGSVGSAIVAGQTSGPIQWAFAFVLVVAALVGGWFLWRRIRADDPE